MWYYGTSIRVIQVKGSRVIQAVRGRIHMQSNMTDQTRQENGHNCERDPRQKLERSSPPSPHPIPAPTVPPHPTSRDFWPHPPLQKHRYPEVGIRGCCQRVSKGCSEPGVPTSVLASTARVELDREKVMVSREKFESKRQRPPPGDFERYVPDSQRLVPCAAVNLKIGP